MGRLHRVWYARRDMGATRDYLALDLGATSGRGLMGSFDGVRVVLREVYRFLNGPIERGGHLHWDWPRIQSEVERALVAASRVSQSVCSVGCDSWGLDHGFLDKDGALLEFPYCYQDTRTAAVAQDVERILTREELVGRTAAPFTAISTLGQFLATRRTRPDLLERAETFLFVPGLVHHHLTGTVATEYVGACPSELCSWRTRDWDRDLIAAFGFPARIFPEVRPTGALLGVLRPELCRRLGIPAWGVHLPAGHDTALAMAAAPANEDDLVISSGTWAMLGVPVSAPICAADALRMGGGTYGVPGDRWVFMRGIMGLWLLDRLCKEERLPEPFEATALAEAATPFQCDFDPEDERITRAKTLREALETRCHERGRPHPADMGLLVRGILESLALFVDHTLRQMQAVTGRAISRIVVVGGGSKNRLLNQWMANACGLPVVAGPPEAAALGNILVQAVGRGDLASLAEARAVAARSWPSRLFEPADQELWAEGRETFGRAKEEEACL